MNKSSWRPEWEPGDQREGWGVCPGQQASGLDQGGCRVRCGVPAHPPLMTPALISLGAGDGGCWLLTAHSWVLPWVLHSCIAHIPWLVDTGLQRSNFLSSNGHNSGGHANARAPVGFAEGSQYRLSLHPSLLPLLCHRWYSGNSKPFIGYPHLSLWVLVNLI